MDEAHVEHAVGLVQDEALDPADIEQALPHQIPKAAGGGDQNVRAPLEGFDLGYLGHAAVDDGGHTASVTAVLAEVLVNLQRQLTGGRQDQGAHRAFLALHGAAQPLQNRNRERSRLAGAGLGTAHQVAPLCHRADRLALDRGRFGVSHLPDGAQNRLINS